MITKERDRCYFCTCKRILNRYHKIGALPSLIPIRSYCLRLDLNLWHLSVAKSFFAWQSEK